MSLKAKLEAIIYAAETPITLDQMVLLVRSAVAGDGETDDAEVRSQVRTALDELAADFPHLTIIAAHIGWPWVEETTAVVLHKGNVYWELSGYAPKYFPDQLVKDVRGRLKDKILFGSDYPSMPYERLLREWDELGYSDEIKEGVFSRNAERVLNLPKSSAAGRAAASSRKEAD